MSTWKLRLFRIAPGVSLAMLAAYTSSVLTDATRWSPQINSLILCWLGVFNVAAFGGLGWALASEALGRMRLDVEALRWVQPVSVSLAQSTAVVGGGTVYGTALDERTQPVPQVRRAGRRRRNRRADQEPSRPPLALVAPEAVPKINGSILN